METRSPRALAPYENVHIPPKEAAALALLVVDTLLFAWHGQRVELSSRLFRIRKSLEFALSDDHGWQSLTKRSRARH